MTRIAKFLSAAGISSRRKAEELISAGRVSVNGARTDNLGLVLCGDEEVRVDGELVIYKAQTPRLWEFHKPPACIVSEKDERARPTIFDKIAALKMEGLPRLIAIGRLDYNSEGLLLLTDNGALARVLELPDNEVERHYRVRILGTPKGADLRKLQSGMTVEGVRYRPMDVQFGDRNSDAATNSWLDVILREGKNREIRKLFEALGYPVNRLIRTGFGDFSLAGLAKGALRQVESAELRRRLAKTPQASAFFA